MKIGVIAEEKNDVEVLYEITGKLLPQSSFSFSHFVGHGCGKLRKKCSAWAENLLRRGCTHLVVLHDCDRYEESDLRAELEKKISACEIEKKLVLIPVEELEAWLLSDSKAIEETFSMKKPLRIKKEPESIESPKEFLEALVWRAAKLRYLNTVHNKRIASRLRLTQLRRCRSYRPYPKFIKDGK